MAKYYQLVVWFLWAIYSFICRGEMPQRKPRKSATLEVPQAILVQELFPVIYVESISTMVIDGNLFTEWDNVLVSGPRQEVEDPIIRQEVEDRVADMIIEAIADQTLEGLRREAEEFSAAQPLPSEPLEVEDAIAEAEEAIEPLRQQEAATQPVEPQAELPVTQPKAGPQGTAPASPTILTISLVPQKSTKEKFDAWSKIVAEVADIVFDPKASRQDAFDVCELLKQARSNRFSGNDYPEIEKMIKDDGNLPETLINMFFNHKGLRLVLERAIEASEKTKAWTLINSLVGEHEKLEMCGALVLAKDALFDRTSGKKKEAIVVETTPAPVPNPKKFKEKSWQLGHQFTEALRRGNIGAAESALREMEVLSGESRPDLWDRIEEAAARRPQNKKGKKSSRNT